MASSRDDFIIAIRSAFLKKSTKQNFSLLTLVFISIFIITLSSFNFTIIQKIRSIISEFVYRTSFIVSIPENFIKDSYSEIKLYSNFYNDYKKNEIKLKTLISENISSEIVESENKELKKLIEDYTVTTNKILAKVIVDHSTTFLKTIIINKGSTDKIKIGTNIYDKNYLVGRVIEVNYKSSRVLLLTDLNSSVPISIIPGDIQAIITGDGSNSGELKYIKDNLSESIEDQSIAYTSGAGLIFKSGIPVGQLNTSNKPILVNFYSDFTQLKYVFAEVEEEKENKKEANTYSNNDNNLVSSKNTELIKLNILNEEIEILDKSNSKLIDENNYLKSETSQLNQKVFDLQKQNNIQKEKLNQNIINKKELEFLKLNLIYSSKCQKTIFKKGFKVGTQEYKDCILRKGKKEND